MRNRGSMASARVKTCFMVSTGHARRALESAQRSESTWALQHLAAIEETLAAQKDQAARELLGDLAATRRTLGSSPA
ncbi:hypothetical protein AB0H88_27300 [Nonomuraea sp. NPDC050680]|uniref:hypothetical protein n=1 Tax=Nonomuraea sp. NPDC050680 TaxID=3154630 RepID=UPI0033FDDCE5